MASSNRERVGQGLEALAKGLRPFVDQHMPAPKGRPWWEALSARDGRTHSPDDPQALLNALALNWNEVFRKILGRVEHSYVNELRDARNAWAHNHPFSTEDTVRALDTMERLLTSVSAADQAAMVRKMRLGVLREQFERETRREVVKAVAATADTGVTGLHPWREVAIPHADVRSGELEQAEFAADLWQASHGGGGPEYADPVEFFRRTYLTVGLRALLAQAVRRVAKIGGAPVVDLQTNFGGGKTHSMLALYHLFSGRPLSAFPEDVRELVTKQAGVEKLPEVTRAVLVGTWISPGQFHEKKDGTRVNTLWGELAWQLGGRASYEVVARADRSRTNPGEALKTLLERHAPVLVLIDEWIAYARQLFAADDLSGGTFDTQFTFAQALTEQVKAVPGALLVVSVPASDRGDSDPEIEVGGVGGLESLRRLRNVLHRVDSPWRPASAEESFSIVRRRLFEPTVGEEVFRARDATARSFFELYHRDHSAEFPRECKEPAYEERLRNAYPIHPELFDRLYEDWSTLDKFQRTRGVLRLMAKVIHELWGAGDAAPLIMPGSLPLSHSKVEEELTRNLDDHWKPIIDADVDGVGSLPVQIDAANPRFQQRHATRRVARTLFLGSAPTSGSPNHGLEEQRVRLGTVLPGEPTAVFNDALRRLGQQATYLYADGERYWYAVQPSVNRKAKDIAERLRGQEDIVEDKLVACLRDAVSVRDTCFAGVHVAPDASMEVTDELRCRLVVLGPGAGHSRSETSEALRVAEEILRVRGTIARSFRNMLVFLAPDASRVPDLSGAVRELLAWQEIDDSADAYNLDTYQRTQVTNRLASAEQTVTLRLAEAYQWLLIPSAEPTSPDVRWQKLRFDGRGGIGRRASEKLLDADMVRVRMGPGLVSKDLRGVLAPLWESGHVSVGKLWEHYARYLYLVKVRDIDVLLDAVRRGGAAGDDVEGFATAASYDETTGRYEGLVFDAAPEVTTGTLLVKLDVARARPCPRCGEPTHIGPCGEGDGEKNTCPRCGGPVHEGACGGATTCPRCGKRAHTGACALPPPRRPTRFHAAVRLDPERLDREITRVQWEVLQHLKDAGGGGLTLTLEIHAESTGYDENTIRTVSENARTLKFDQFGFEQA